MCTSSDYYGRVRRRLGKLCVRRPLLSEDPALDPGPIGVCIETAGVAHTEDCVSCKPDRLSVCARGRVTECVCARQRETERVRERTRD